MFDGLFGTHSQSMKDQFGCPNGQTECKEQFARYVMAVNWICNTKWALSGIYKTQPSALGPIYPMQFEEPTCEKEIGFTDLKP